MTPAAGGASGAVITTAYRKPGHFAGWPANYGMWSWGDEVAAVVVVGRTGPLRGLHARDTSRPFVPMVLRSTDGGRTWDDEPFTGTVPGGRTLSGDEHVDDSLKIGPRLAPTDLVRLPRPVDFTDPETMVMAARTDLAAGSRSWFYVSRDRCRSWSGPHPFGPHPFGPPGLSGLSARTDVVALSSDGALWGMTTPKPDGSEGRVVWLRTDDGARTFRLLGGLEAPDGGWHIMPSSVRTPEGMIISAVRSSGRADADHGGHWIECWSSTDEGLSWRGPTIAVGDTGVGGNPPAATRLADDRLVITYGRRTPPYGLASVISSDAGRTWSVPRLIAATAVMGDLGYPRTVALPDDHLLTLAYTNGGDEGDRWIEAVRWRP